MKAKGRSEAFIDRLAPHKIHSGNRPTNTILLKNKIERDAFLKYTNENEIMTRPIWQLMNKLVMFKDCQCGDIRNAKWLEERVVNIPSSYRV